METPMRPELEDAIFTAATENKKRMRDMSNEERYQFVYRTLLDSEAVWAIWHDEQSYCSLCLKHPHIPKGGGLDNVRASALFVSGAQTAHVLRDAVRDGDLRPLPLTERKH
jgi:hypothetical protein